MDAARVHRNAWTIANSISVLLFIVLIAIWYKIELKHADLAHLPQLTSMPQVYNYLANTWEKHYALSKPTYISTGILLSTLSFDADKSLIVSGYIWQHFPNNLPSDIKHKFFLPDQIGLNKQHEIFVYNYPDEDVIVTSFEILIRQGFDYGKYPFDDQILPILILPLQFYKNIILVPDLMAYPNVSTGKIFGIDPDITLSDFHIRETYYGYDSMDFDTNFGISNIVTQYGYPTLYFAVVLKRALFSALVVHVLPLCIVILLLFAIVMMSSERKDKFIKFNFTGTMSVSACSALFFVLVLVHGNVRNQIYSDKVLYIEYFYFLAYILIALVVFNNYILLNDGKKKIKFMHYGDNLIPKILFWPCIFLFSVIVSLKILT